MAVSLKCNDCGALLRNVAEAQAHSDATAHANFSESTEVIRLMVCKSCGKPCRTDAEQGLHTRFTGHTEYDAREAGDVIDTEAQMAAAKQQAEDDLDADAELLGLRRKKKPQQPETAAGAGGAAAAAAAGAGGGADGAAAAGGSGGEQQQQQEGGGGGGADGDELVPVEVRPELLKELLDMGFGEARGARALHFSGNSSVEGAVNWLTEHEADADLDEPLLVPKATVKHQLTQEQARAQAAELVRKAKERREREEAEAARHRERERIRAGKELLEAKRKEEEGAMRRLVEERRREKEEEARAREKARAKVEEDRRARRRKLGLPEEPTEEERAREAEKARKKAEEEAARRHAYVKPVSAIEKLRAQLVAMKKAAVAARGDAAGGEAFKACAATLLKLVGNVARAPDEAKFRSVNTGNAAIQARVLSVPGALEFLKLVGFSQEEPGEGGATLAVMPRDGVSLELLNAAGGEINNALTNPFFGVL